MTGSCVNGRSIVRAVIEEGVPVGLGRERHIFLQLAVDDLFRAKWTTDIHRGWDRDPDSQRTAP